MMTLHSQPRGSLFIRYLQKNEGCTEGSLINYVV